VDFINNKSINAVEYTMRMLIGFNYIFTPRSSFIITVVLAVTAFNI
jgi:hypothetical protein